MRSGCHPADEYPAFGQRTGIKVVDCGWIGHLHIEPGMDDVLPPILRHAQRVRSSGKPLAIFGPGQSPPRRAPS